MTEIQILSLKTQGTEELKKKKISIGLIFSNFGK